MNSSKYILNLLLLTLTTVMIGCTALKPFPQAARSGDTIALAVGSPDGMTRANTTVSYISDSNPGVPIDVTPDVRAIFKLFPDGASFQPDTSHIVRTSGHSPWLTVVAIDLPAGLPVGTGVFQFNTTATYPTIGSHINNIDIAFEVLPGTGAPHQFEYEFGLGASNIGNLTQLEPEAHAMVRPDFTGTSIGWPNYGAVEMQLRLQTSLGTSLTDDALRIEADDMGKQTNSRRNIMSSLSNGEDLTVIFLSPTGKLTYYEPRFAIVPTGGFVSLLSAPTLESVRYYDTNGNEVAGPAISDYTITLE